MRQRIGSAGLRRVRRWWRHWHWLVIGGLAAVAFVLGTVGFDRYFDQHADPRTLGDDAYHSIQLFALESAAAAPPIPWQLEVARVLAPLVAITALLAAVAAIFRDQLARFSAHRLLRNHVIVCGLGWVGARLALGFTESGYRVLALEQHPDVAGGHRVDTCRDEGVVVLVGDAVDDVREDRVGIERASIIVAACGDDGVNAEVAIATRRALETARARRHPLRRLLRRVGGRSRRPLECFVHIDDPELCRLLEAARPPLPAVDDELPMALSFFNPSANAAPALLADYPVGPIGGDPWTAPAHMVVVGLGEMGTNLVVHAARCWRALHGMEAPALPVTVVDRDAPERVDLMLTREPRVKDVCAVTAVSIPVGSAAFDEGAFLRADADGSATSVYVCLDDDARGLSAALAVHRALGSRRVPVVVRTAERGGLAALLQETHTSEEFANLHAFGLVERVCRPETLLDERNELLARAIHERYVRRRRAAGDTLATNPNMGDWDDLPEEIRESNRNRAEHTAALLAGIGCAIVPLRGWDVDVVAFTDDEIEHMARAEHDRWRAERESDGWRHGSERDVARRLSPALVPWDALPDDVQAENREIVRDMPAFLVSAGFLVTRGDPWEIVARAIHDDYVRNQRLDGQTVQTNPSMAPWERLPDTLRASNLDQAQDVRAKLAAVGCEIVPITTRDVVPAVFTRGEVERLAEIEHDRWWREREAAGWTPGPRDVDAKRSPYLVPYEELPEDVKDYDRNTVRGIPAFVAHAGFSVVRASR